VAARQSNSGGTSFEVSRVGWGILEHVFRNNIFVLRMNYKTKCSRILNLEVLTYYGMIHSIINFLCFGTTCSGIV